MTRRLTLGILGCVVAALMLSGLGTLLIANNRAKHTTEKELRREARDLASGLGDVLQGDLSGPADTPAERLQLAQRLRIINAARTVIDVNGIDILVYRRGVSDQVPPAGVDLSQVDIRAVTNGTVESGSSGHLVWAVAGTPAGPRNNFLLVILTRKADVAFGGTLRWFLLAAGIVIMLGAAVAWLIGRGLTRPVRAASAAAHRIAAGDFATRLPEPRGRHDELAELSSSINTMASELERSRQLEQRFLLSVSHDLRTPLTSIRGYADAIVDGVGEPARSAAVLRSEADRLERLVTDLLDLSKMTSGSFSLHLQRLDLSALVAASVEGFAPDAAERGLHLVAQPFGPLPIDGDRDRLAQVVGNLVQNALKFAHGEIIVSVTAWGGEAVLTVDDDGPGIAREDLPHVFERLYVSARRPARKESSTGLGLAITKELVEAMGGTAKAGSSPSGGARLEVRLPLRP